MNIVWQKAPIQIDQISLILSCRTVLYCLLVTLNCASMVKYESIMFSVFLYYTLHTCFKLLHLTKE